MLGLMHRSANLGRREEESAGVIPEPTKAPAGVEPRDVPVERIHDQNLEGRPLHHFMSKTHCLGKEVRAQPPTLVP